MSYKLPEVQMMSIYREGQGNGKKAYTCGPSATRNMVSAMYRYKTGAYKDFTEQAFASWEGTKEGVGTSRANVASALNANFSSFGHWTTSRPTSATSYFNTVTMDTYSFHQSVIANIDTMYLSFFPTNHNLKHFDFVYGYEMVGSTHYLWIGEEWDPVYIYGQSNYQSYGKHRELLTNRVHRDHDGLHPWNRFVRAKSAHCLLIAFILMGLSGCDRGHGPPKHALQSQNPETTDRGVVRPPIARTVKQIDLGGSVGAISGDSKRLVYPSRQEGDLDRASVMSVDLTTGKRRRVAHSAFPHGYVGWAGVSGSWTVFVDQSKAQGDGDMDVLWRVVAANPETHQLLTLLSNGQTPDPWVPWMSAGDDYIAWSSAERDGKRTAHEWLWRHDWSSPRTVMRHAVLTPGTESVSGDSLIYLGPSTGPHRQPEVGGDCWQVPLAGGSPTPLTHTGLAMGCAANDTWLVWTQHIDPETKSPPPDGIFDDPYEIWSEPIGGKPMLLHHGYSAGYWPIVAGHFTIWGTQDGRRVVQDLGDPRSVLFLARTNYWDLGAALDRSRFALPNENKPDDHAVVDLVDVARRS
ncbi:hypothetical protein EFL95_05315 [Nocardioides marmorisolisilvae]|uniref:Uncharacterized protein n=1 Tax=Nocardioides marmorisolisilvae TaxID=1542737 RepID=A0A3N0DSB0_9ACTN|nr:hypothetical protein EFL95_05315 [Nocardioides marmorisolisilvae]